MNNREFIHADSPALDWSDDAPLVAVSHHDLPDTVPAPRKTLSACPHCGSDRFLLSERYVYDASICDIDGTLDHSSNPKSGGYDVVTCHNCSSKLDPARFNFA